MHFHLSCSFQVTPSTISILFDFIFILYILVLTLGSLQLYRISQISFILPLTALSLHYPNLFISSLVLWTPIFTHKKTKQNWV